MAQRGGGYQGLERIGDAGVRAVCKNIFDRLGALEQRLTTLEGQVRALPPAGVTVAQMQAYVQQQVAQLKTQVQGLPATYPVVAGVPGTPNSVPADALPLYDGTAIVQGVFAANPAFVATSCQDDPGGTWDLMDAIVDALRAVDTRFGYNGKRGNINDPSKDAISYDYAAVAGGEGSTTVYIVDVIAGHCGPSPSAAFNDVTVFAPGVWTGRGRF